MDKEINIVASLPYQGPFKQGDFIGVDRGASYLLDKGIDMLFAIGDFDSIDPACYEKLIASNISVFSLDTEKDETDLAAAIHVGRDLGYTKFNIYGALGGRVDHTLININLLKKNHDVILYDEDSLACVVPAGVNPLTSEQLTYKFFSFFCIEETTLTLENFKYSLDNYILNCKDTLCISNEGDKSSVIINDKPIIMIAAKV